MFRAMSFMSTFVSLLLGFLILITLDGASALALPAPGEVKIVKRDVWAPPVTSPTVGTVWQVGDTVQVTWSTKNPPKELTNSIGKVVLRTSDGFVKGQGGLNEPLASNFSIFDGSVNITVPKVPARGDYQVILFGDSGNTSPYFTITSPMLAAMADFALSN